MNRFATFASGLVLAVSLFAPAVSSVLAYSPDDQFVASASRDGRASRRVG